MSSPVVILFEALLGGLVLNVMPCVLPVLTMKVFHAVEHGGANKRARQIHGLAYTAGVLAAFVLLAVGVLALRAAGRHVGWGMQFQHPQFVAALVALIFTFGLNSLGVFEWTLSLSARPGQEGYGASFGNGVFAAVMSTPCSAPFLGTAAAFALGADTPAWLTLAIFVAIGLGLASPFALVSFAPGVGKLLPRPGPWMETFKHLMGFTLLAAAVWLFGTLQAQVTRAAATDFLYFLLVLAVALWGVHHFGGVLYGTARRYAVRAIATALVVTAGWQLVHFERERPTMVPVASAAPSQPGSSVTVASDVVRDGHIVWTPFDPAKVKASLADKRPVFMDFTAEWCANCKTNERVSLETDKVRNALAAADFLPMKADWTNEDETIGQWLQQLGRSGIPAYVIYLPDGSRDLLPEGLVSADTFVEHIQAAARKYPATGRARPSVAPTASGAPALPGAAVKVGSDVLHDGHIVWTPFDPARVKSSLADKRPVFMDFTAEWCANCKTNERVSLETDKVRTALAEAHFLPMKADWTNEDETIAQWLQQLGRSGIPAYVIYLPDGSRDLLPEGLVSADTFVERIQAAARKFPASQQVSAAAH